VLWILLVPIVPRALAGSTRAKARARKMLKAKEKEKMASPLAEAARILARARANPIANGVRRVHVGNMAMISQRTLVRNREIATNAAS
jgi:hypothetical protein